MNRLFWMRWKWWVFAIAVAFSVLCAGALLKVHLAQDLSAMIPASLTREVSLFQASVGSGQIFVIVKGSSEEEALASAQTVQEKLLALGLIEKPAQGDENFVFSLLDALPYRFSAADENLLKKWITPTEIAAQTEQNYERLLSLEGHFLKPFILADPLGLTRLMGQKLSALGQGFNVEFSDGFLRAQDEPAVMALYRLSFSANDFDGARRLEQSFQKITAALPSSVQVFYLGGPRYTVENMSVIRRDLVKITVLALLLLGGVFFLFFRNKNAVFIYLLPLWVLPPAALVTYFIFGQISGITVGFGSVVAGLAVDYGIYLFFAIGYGGVDPFETVHRLKKHLFCNYITSVLCFAALFASHVELFHQLAVFSITALTLALLAALYIFPLFWQHIPHCTTVMYEDSRAGLKRSEVFLLTVLILLFGAWGLSHLKISGELEDLNGVSARFKQDKKMFETTFAPSLGTHQKALLFVLGSSPEQVLSRSEKLNVILPAPLPVTQVMPSAQAREDSLTRWQKFWTPSRISAVQNRVRQAAAKRGIKENAFDAFFDKLRAKDFPPDTWDITSLYNPLIKLKDGSYALVHLVPNEEPYRIKTTWTVFVSADRLQRALVDSLAREGKCVLVCALLFNFFALLWIFKNLKTTLLALVPMLLAGCMLTGCFALFHVQLNLFVLVFLPLLVGLGIDYAIFQIIKHTSSAQQLYPTRAVVAAGLSTLAGFGVLAVSTHPVLFMIGISSVLGISGAIFASIVILTPFLQEADL